MLAKKFRLTTEAFRLHARQKSSHTERSVSFTIKAYTSGIAHPRFGIVIGKKIDASAVVRNRVKRRMYDALGAVINHLPPADYICIMQPGVQNKTKEELLSELTAAFHLKNKSNIKN